MCSLNLLIKRLWEWGVGWEGDPLSLQKIKNKPHPVPNQVGPWLSNGERGKQYTAKGIKNVVSLNTATKEPFASRGYHCLFHDIAMPVGTGSCNSKWPPQLPQWISAEVGNQPWLMLPQASPVAILSALNSFEDVLLPLCCFVCYWKSVHLLLLLST